MRAVLHHRYGGPEGLELGEIPRPDPGPGEVLVEVHAASINSADLRMMRADPWLVRLDNGLTRPRKWPVLGSDFAGRVVARGEGVESVALGAAVFGDATPDGRGSFADFVRVRASTVVPIPPGLRFVEAAAVPLAGVTALQAVRDLAQVGPGQSVLVYGAGGGVGGFVVQLAKARGADVTAVCSAASRAQVEGFGADLVLDYASEDFAARPERYDAILAVNGHRRLRVYRDALKPGGRLVVVGGSNRQIFAGLLLAPLVFLGRGKSARVLIVDEARLADDLDELAVLLERGALRVAIDRVVPLEQFADAIRQVEGGHVGGKLVLELRT